MAISFWGTYLTLTAHAGSFLDLLGWHPARKGQIINVLPTLENCVPLPAMVLVSPNDKDNSVSFSDRGWIPVPKSVISGPWDCRCLFCFEEMHIDEKCIVLKPVLSVCRGAEFGEVVCCADRAGKSCEPLCHRKLILDLLVSCRREFLFGGINFNGNAQL